MLSCYYKMKLGIAGSRGITNYVQFKDALEAYLKTCAPISEIVSGGARGVDSLAAQYARQHNLALTEFKPDWNTYGKSAGYRRNVDIVNASDEVFVVWDGVSKGTNHTINITKKAGKPIHVELIETIKKPVKRKCSTIDSNLITYVVGDLFDAKGALGHCVSADFAMGAGIARIFRSKFGQVQALKDQHCKIGDVATLQANPFIYYLVTKQCFFHKPTYKSLEQSLIKMRDHMLSHDVSQINLPRIGCGLDKLEWSKVEQILLKTFETTSIKCIVYTLPE